MIHMEQHNTIIICLRLNTNLDHSFAVIALSKIREIYIESYTVSWTPRKITQALCSTRGSPTTEQYPLTVKSLRTYTLTVSNLTTEANNGRNSQPFRRTRNHVQQINRIVPPKSRVSVHGHVCVAHCTWHHYSGICAFLIPPPPLETLRNATNLVTAVTIGRKSNSIALCPCSQ